MDMIHNIGRVEKSLERILITDENPERDAFLSYLLRPTGQKLRPTLFFQVLSSEEKPVDDQAVELACGVELVHLASLVHDDILDESQTRRGMPSFYMQFGTKNAVIMGDYLFARSFEIFSSYASGASNLASEVVHDMCDGQIAQMGKRDDLELDMETYMDIITKKTGRLFELSSGLAAIYAGSDHVDYWRDFGRELGIMYQMIDDYRDIMHDEGQDVAVGELTQLSILLRDKMDPEAFSSLMEQKDAGAVREQVAHYGIDSVVKAELQQKANELAVYMQQRKELMPILAVMQSKLP